MTQRPPTPRQWQPALTELSKTARELGMARKRRNAAIIIAAAGGVSRKEIAKAVGLTRGRVDQIARGER